MPWPVSNRATLYDITAVDWNEVAAALALWGGQTNANGNSIINLTLDAEATGNGLILPFKTAFPTAKAQAGVAQGALTLPAANAPTPVLIGADPLWAALSFSDSASQSCQDRFRLPSDWTLTGQAAAMEVELLWRTPATTGNVVWQIQTAFAGDGEVVPAFNAAQLITDAAKATTLQLNTTTALALTTTGAAAGKEFFFKILRDPAHASDTIAAAAELISVTFTLRRLC